MNGAVPAGRSGLWRAVWRRFLAQQRLIAFPAAAVAAQAVLLVPLAIADGRMHSFSSFARGVYHVDQVLKDELDRLGDLRVSAWLGLAVYLLGQAAVDAWLRPGYLSGLAGGAVTLRPARRVALRVGTYSLVFGMIELLIDGLADPAPPVALLLFLVSIPVFLYGDYAIVLDEVGVVEGLRRSLRAARTALLPTIIVVLVLQLGIVPLVDAAFRAGFDDTTYVFAPYLLAYLLVLAVEQYAIDVALVTIYLAIPAARRRGNG